MEDLDLQSLEIQVRNFCNKCSEIKQKISEREEADSVVFRQESAIKQ